VSGVSPCFHLERYFKFSTHSRHYSLTIDCALCIRICNAIDHNAVTNEKSEHNIKDASVIFNTVWQQLVVKHGTRHLVFPKEIIWLMGAPGSGKGTQTPFINQARGISARPIVMSNLLTSPEAVKLKNAGHLVGDRYVLMCTVCKRLRV
jgi:hypothetical protein